MQRQIEIPDFRRLFMDNLFNGEVRKKMSEFKNDVILGATVDQYQIDEVFDTLKKYYKMNIHELDIYFDYKIDDDLSKTLDRVVNVLFSYWLQDCIYVFAHERRVRPFNPRSDIPNLLLLMKQELFLSSQWEEPREGWNVLNSLSNFKNLDLVKNLLATAKSKYGVTSPEFKNFLEHKNKKNRSSLYLACMGRSEDIIQELLTAFSESYGFNNVEDFMNFIGNKDRDDGASSFFIACKDGLNKTVLSFLDYMNKFPDQNPGNIFDLINQKDKRNSTPLIEACRNGHKEMVALLLSTAETYADNDSLINYIMQRDDEGNSALTRACQCGNIEIVKLLISKFQKAVGNKDDEKFLEFINTITNENFSPLHNACHFLYKENDPQKKQQFVEIIKVLMEFGVNSQLLTRQGKTARQFLPAEFKYLIETTEQESRKRHGWDEIRERSEHDRGHHRHREHRSRDETHERSEHDRGYHRHREHRSRDETRELGEHDRGHHRHREHRSRDETRERSEHDRGHHRHRERKNRESQDRFFKKSSEGKTQTEGTKKRKRSDSDLHDNKRQKK